MAGVSRKEERAPEPLPFEQALARLEALVAGLERGDLTLEQSLSAFEEGMKLARECGRRLEEAQQRVQLLLEEASGEARLEPFADDQPDKGV